MTRVRRQSSKNFTQVAQEGAGTWSRNRGRRREWGGRGGDTRIGKNQSTLNQVLQDAPPSVDFNCRCSVRRALRGGCRRRKGVELEKRETGSKVFQGQRTTSGTKEREKTTKTGKGENKRCWWPRRGVEEMLSGGEGKDFTFQKKSREINDGLAEKHSFQTSSQVA